MKKITIITAFCFALISEGQAQKYFSAGLNLSRGNKYFPVNAKTGIGLSLAGYLALHHSGGIRGSVAYDFFKQRTFDNPDTLRALGLHGKNLAFIPLGIGYQQFIIPDELFVFSSIGISFLQSSVMYVFKPRRLTYDFGAGYNISLSQSRLLEVSGFYNFNRAGQFNISENYFTLRVGYGFR